MSFFFNLHGYRFQQSTRILRDGYLSASRALVSDVERARAEAAKYAQDIENGGEWIEERDEEGHLLYTKEQALELQIETSDEALSALRKAFVIAAYHYWERATRLAVGGNDKAKHNELVVLAVAKGIAIHPDLGAVRDLVNLLKHDNAKRGAALQQSWGSVLSPSFLSRPGRTDWYAAVFLTEDDVAKAFDVVANSGPTFLT